MRFGTVVLCLGAFTVAACGGSGDAAPVGSTTSIERDAPQSTTSTTSTTLSSAERTEADLLAAYETAWQHYSRAGDPPDPDAASLADHYTGVALQAVRDQFAVFVAEGVVLRGEYRPAAEVVEVDGTSARLRDCAVDALELVNPTSGEVLRESGAVEVGAFVDMVSEDGAWKISTYTRDEGACA